MDFSQGCWQMEENRKIAYIIYIYMNVIRIICILAHLPIINSKSKEIILGVRTTWEAVHWPYWVARATIGRRFRTLPFESGEGTPEAPSVVAAKIESQGSV